MSGNFELNEKFWSMDGILGRRGFIVNTLIIQIISGICVAPVVYLLLFKPELILDSIMRTTITTADTLYLVFVLGCLILECVLFFPSILRRVRDITADDDNNNVMMISSVIITVMLIASLPFMSQSLAFKLNWISLAIVIFLMVIPGKITSEKPASELIKFNWGAFFGTWYWGIYNKVPKTLIMIPLLFTGYAWFPFMLLCGMKGNEWAREKNNQKPIEDFHGAQKAQSIAFIFIAPLLSFLIFLISVVSISVYMLSYVKAHPDFKTKIEAINDRYLDISMKAYFSNIELGKDENKFYMEPKIWINMSDSQKRQTFDAAVTYIQRQDEKAKTKKDDHKDEAAKEKDKNLELPKDETAKEKDKNLDLSKFETARTVKILSSFNNEVLASYEYDINEYSKLITPGRKVSFKEFYKFQKNAYKFNNRPTLP